MANQERLNPIKRIERPQHNGNGQHTKNVRPPENHAFSEPLLPIGGQMPDYEDVFGVPLDLEPTNNVETTKPEYVYLNCVIESKKTSAQIYDGQTRKHTILRLPKDIEPGSIITFPNRHGSWDKCMVIGFTLLDNNEPVAIEVTPPVQFLQFNRPEASGKPVTKLEKILTDYPEKTDGRLSTAEVAEIRKAVNIKSTQTFRKLT